MNCLRTIAGSGLALVLTLSAPLVWGQSVPKDVTPSGASGEYQAKWTTTPESASLMDENVSRDVKRAWSEGKNATAAMAFQENGEIAMSEGKEREASRYFQAAETELGTLEPENTSY
jgi:hypothetical protein